MEEIILASLLQAMRVVAVVAVLVEMEDLLLPLESPGVLEAAGLVGMAVMLPFPLACKVEAVVAAAGSDLALPLEQSPIWEMVDRIRMLAWMETVMVSASLLDREAEVIAEEAMLAVAVAAAFWEALLHLVVEVVAVQGRMEQ